MVTHNPTKLHDKVATSLALSIAYTAIDDLRAAPRQSRKHGKKQISKLAASITQFGFIVPVIIDEAGVILNGHACVEAAKTVGLTEVPTVSVSHLSPEKKRALAIALDRLTELGEWDNDLLRLELAELTELNLDFSLELTGFDTAEIDIMLDGASDAEGDKVEMVDDEPADVAVAQLGDLWLLGKHKVLCGRCHDPINWQRLMSCELGRMVFSDPPFNCPVNGHVCGLGKHQHREFAEGAGEMSDSQFTQWLTDALRAMATPLIDGAILFVAMDWRNLLALQLAARETGMSLINICVWNKKSGGMGSLWRSKYELFCVFKKGKAPHVNNVQLGRFGRYRTNVWDYAGVNSFGRTRDKDLADHPTVKPTALVADAIRDVSHHGDIVLDGFLGSGSTILAAERTKRRAYGTELDPLYVDVIIRRWEQASGGKAILEATGETHAEVKERRAREATREPQRANTPIIRERARPLAA